MSIYLAMLRYSYL